MSQVVRQVLSILDDLGESKLLLYLLIHLTYLPISHKFRLILSKWLIVFTSGINLNTFVYSKV